MNSNRIFWKVFKEIGNSKKGNSKKITKKTVNELNFWGFQKIYKTKNII